MTLENATLARLGEAVEALRQEMVRLNQRVAALEATALGAAQPTSARPTAQATPVPAQEDLSDELVMVIGAAIAAFLGKKAHVRQIRLLGSAAWLHQGRVTIQASHSRSS
jgi:methylmalonyl-CoA carboxyltransferase large subunit